MIGNYPVRESLLGWLYPPLCTICDDPLTSKRHAAMPFLCETCESHLGPIGDDACHICGQQYETALSPGISCANCGDRELAIDYAVSGYRSSGTGRDIIHQLKYEKKRHLGRLLGTLIGAVWGDERLRGEHWIVVPVPLFKKRERERGFNQSEEIVRELMRHAPSDVTLRSAPLLRRVRNTQGQAQLDRKDRLVNLKSAFETVPKLPKGVADEALCFLLVDDVITTGTTVSECAAALRESFDVDVIAAVSAMRG